MPPLEVWEKVLIDADALAGDVHGYVPCATCHGGDPDVQGLDMEAKYASHEGLIRDPSIDAQAACGDCHNDIAPYQALSLHNNLAGYDTDLYARSLPENHATIEEGESYHCNSCHTTCGQCHISQPTSVGGGLISGHVYERTPSMSRQCTACHGSRVKNEYTGAHEGLSADVHLRSGRMVCTDCHTEGDMHGTDYVNSETEQVPTHRYDGAQSPTCESCHADQVGVGSGNPYHEAHGTETLSCQTCHSISYANCYSCHLERTDEDVPYFRLEEEELGFFIARNPLRDGDRPYRYVPVRHVPTWPGLFDLYGDNVLDQFENKPTWTYATPHNIQKNTPQTQSCETCHDSTQYFLTEDKVRPDELAANEALIVSSAPPIPSTYGAGTVDAESSVSSPAVGSVDPLDAPESVGPLDGPGGVDPLDAAPSGEVDPLDAQPEVIDPLDAQPAASPTIDPLDA